MSPAAGASRLITKAATVQGREPESQEFLEGLRDYTPTRDFSVDRAYIPSIQIRVICEDLKKSGVTGQRHRSFPRRGDVLVHPRRIYSLERGLRLHFSV